ncbi:hypothetical protein BST61_g11436 [Cercospora zeina]
MDDTTVDDVADQRVDRSHPELLLLQITPANDAAQDVFDHLATILRAQPRDPSLDKVRLLFDASMSPQHRFYSPTSGSEEGEEGAFAAASAAARTGGGAFIISLQNPPIFPKRGWTIGRGSQRLNHRGVDIILPSSKKWQVHTSHATITFGEHGALCLQAYHSDVEVNGTLVSKENYYALSRRQNRIKIGLLELRVDYLGDEASAKEHADAKAAFLSRNRPELGAPHPVVSATPSDQDIYIGGAQWKIHGVVGVGGSQQDFGRTIIDAVNHLETGKVYALKTRERFNRQTANAIQDEINQYSRLDAALPPLHKARLHIMHIKEVLWPAQKAWTSGLQDRVHIIYQPLCWADFNTIIRHRPIDHEGLVSMLFQVLQGLNFLHMHDIVHRDIKPANLAYQLTQPPRAVIIDLQTIRFLSDYKNMVIPPQPGSCGTVGYLAPEMENAAYDEDLGGYGTPVDMWALGTVCLQIFPGLLDQSKHWKTQPNPFREPVNSAEVFRCKGAMAALCRQPIRSPELSQLVGFMLIINPEARFSAKRALDSPVFDCVPRQWRDVDTVEPSLRASSPKPGEKRAEICMQDIIKKRA